MAFRLAAPTSNLETSTATLAAVAGICMFAIRAYQGVWFQGFVDETTHLLGARLLNSGGLLYRDFVDNHGPVIYILASAYGSLAGWSAPNYARLIPILLMFMAAGAVIASPALEGRSSRLCATGLFFGLTSCVWMVQGLHQVSFYPVAGALAAILIASFSVPACLNHPIPESAAVAGGFAAGLLFFTGYQYLLTLVPLAAAGLCVCWVRGWYRSAVIFIIGGLAASALMVIWLLIYGDVLGYLAFHIALGQTAYRSFINLSMHSFLGSLVPSFSPKHLVQALATIGLILCAALLFFPLRRSRSPLRVLAWILVVVGVVMLNVRGETTFKNGSFVIGVIALLAIALPAASRLRSSTASSLPIVSIIVVFGVALATGRANTTPLNTTPVVVSGLTPRFLIGQRTSTPLTNYIRSVLRPDDRFLALIYLPDLYFAADRLPMPGYFAYFPWDAAYARNPWFNRPHDLCVALANQPPKLIVFDDTPVWGYRPADYMPCVLGILSERYKRNPDFPTLYEYDYPRAATRQ